MAQLATALAAAKDANDIRVVVTTSNGSAYIGQITDDGSAAGHDCIVMEKVQGSPTGKVTIQLSQIVAIHNY